MKNNIEAPEELKSQDFWINWKFEIVEGKQTKVPCFPSGNWASATEPANWLSYEKAIQAYQENPELDGVGFVFDESNEFMGIDIDECIDGGKLNPEVEQLLEDYNGMLDISPSGQGVKLILKGKKPNHIYRTNIKDILGSEGVEWYDKKRFFTVTGNSYNDSQVITDGAEVVDRLIPYFTSVTNNAPVFSQPSFSASVVENREWGDGDKQQGHAENVFNLQVDPMSNSEYEFRYFCDLAKKYPYDIETITKKAWQSSHARPKWNERRENGRMSFLEYNIRKAISVTPIPLKNYNSWLAYLRYTYEFRYNTVLCTIEFRRQGGKFEELGDQQLNSILNEIRSRGGKIHATNLKEIINQTSMAPDYDPLRAYFEGLPKWDNVDHLAQLTKCISTTNNTLRDLLVKRWLLGLVATIMKGAVNQGFLILKGGQGLGKTSFITRLLPESMREYYYSGTIREDSKDTLMLMVRKLIINMDELASLHKKESSTVKELITKDEISYRAPYATTTKQYRRNASFIGSVNSASFLSDDTGSRRFWILDCTAIDWQAMPDMNKVYSQIMHMLQEGERWWMDRAEQNLVESSNKSFAVPSLEEELVNNYLEEWNSTVSYPLMELVRKLSDKSGYPINQINPRRLRQALINKGIKSVTKNGTIRYKVHIRDRSNTDEFFE